MQAQMTDEKTIQAKRQDGALHREISDLLETADERGWVLLFLRMIENLLDLRRNVWRRIIESWGEISDKAKVAFVQDFVLEAFKIIRREGYTGETTRLGHFVLDLYEIRAITLDRVVEIRRLGKTPPESILARLRQLNPPSKGNGYDQDERERRRREKSLRDYDLRDNMRGSGGGSTQMVTNTERAAKLARKRHQRK